MSNYANRKIITAILAILFGCFGVHKFVLGLPKPGLIMLLATVATCGLLSPVTWVIGFAEGVIYLIKSDEEFTRLYSVEGREWF